VSIATEYRLGEEQIHDVLSNERRKRTLEILKRKRDEVELRTLAERLAEIESGESPPPRNCRQSVYNSLHQTHLPKLNELDIVEYDDDRKTVELQSAARTVDLYMEVLTPYGITWSTYYRTLAVLALITVIADQLGALFLPGDFPLLLASFFLVVIALSTLYQLWSNQWLHLRGLLAE
jgi:hypothetical protein